MVGTRSRDILEKGDMVKFRSGVPRALTQDIKRNADDLPWVVCCDSDSPFFSSSTFCVFLCIQFQLDKRNSKAYVELIVESVVWGC